MNKYDSVKKSSEVNDLTGLSAYDTMPLLTAYWVIVALARWPYLLPMEK